MPWRGPEYKGEFPTLGHYVSEWMEENLIVPDRDERGKPFRLTDEQYKHILWTYRLRPNATAEMRSRAYAFYGVLLMRPQKWGKDPLAAGRVCVEALADIVFDGWDANGEPVGRPQSTPIIQCVANSEEQAPVTFMPVHTMLTEGPLANWPGLDVGLTRINLPGNGKIEAVAASAKSRIGARLTFASFTETHLFTRPANGTSGGGIEVADAMKRNLAGMSGRWIEVTNAYDPSEGSVAQLTHKAGAPGVYVDYRPPRTRVDVHDDAALLEELLWVYGDSAVERGGWVDLNRIKEEIQNPARSEGNSRRFFLNEIVVGSRDAVDALKWAAQGDPSEQLKPKTTIALGFHGGVNREATSLCAARLSDGRIFHLRTWERPKHVPGTEWMVPRHEVDQAVHDAFAAYDVTVMMASPHDWQNEVNAWAGKYQNHGNKWDTTSKVLEIWLNSDIRMDQIVGRFLTAHMDGELAHDGSETLTRHALWTALTQGKKRPAGEADEEPYYRRLTKKSPVQSTSAFVAALLAYEGRGYAIEHGIGGKPPRPNIF